MQMLQLILIVCMASPLSLFGCIANVINMIVISRMNLRQAVNITLLALAVSDFLGLLGTFWTTICFYPAVLESEDIPFIPSEIKKMTGEWMHITFASITAHLTFIISAERCLCIIFPMKVKSLITIGRIKAIIIATFLFGIAVKVVRFYSIRFVWKFSANRNKTFLGVTRLENWAEIEYPSRIISNVMSQYFTFFGVVILTIILVIKLKQQARWRQKTSKTAVSETSTKRDLKVTKTVCVISAIFIICFLPEAINLSVYQLYDFGKAYPDIFTLVYTLTFLGENTNSAINIFVYLTFSTEYTKEFKRVFSFCKPPSPI